MKLAVYGTLKNGHPNHHFMKGSIFLGEFKTEPTFTMYSLGGFPAVTSNGETQITCEVYEVTNLDAIKRIFRLEGYRGKNNASNMYDILAVDSPFGKVFLFYMKNVFSNHKIETGIWTR